MNGLKISELAERAGVNVSTVRFYERIGLVPDPQRSSSGYRLYDPGHEARLLFITRARRLGMSIEQISGLLGVWDGTNCGATRAHVVEQIDENLSEVRARVRELEAFAQQLVAARAELTETDTPAICDPDLVCCTPTMVGPTTVTLTSVPKIR